MHKGQQALDDAIRFERRDGQLIVSGDLDLATAPRLDEVIARLDGETVLDLAGIEFVDSSGIHALVRARHAKPALRIANAPRNVLRVFELAGVTDVLMGDQREHDGS
jgi:anti-sigma B factor antagonist